MNKNLLSLACFVFLVGLSGSVSAQQNISFKYYIDDLDDDGDESDNNFTAMDTGTDLGNELYIGDVFDRYYNIAGTLKYDHNQDDDLGDSDDYTLYHGLYVISGVSEARVRLAYFASNVSALRGTILENLKGMDYLVTKTEAASRYFELGPAITKNLAAHTPPIICVDAVVFFGTAKMLYINASGYSRLYILDGCSIEGFVDISMASAPYDLTDSVHGNSTVFDNYKVFLTSGSGGDPLIEISISDENQIVRIDNDVINVFGYALAKVADDDIISGQPGRTGEELFFLSDEIDINPGKHLDVSDTYFNLKFKSSKKIDVRRKKEVIVASGTFMDKDHEDYRDFLKRDIIPTIVDEDAIMIKYYTDDLDDDYDESDNNFTTSDGSIDLGNRLFIGDVSDSYFGINGTLKYDHNQDGDLKDWDDYTLYHGMYVITGFLEARVGLAYFNSNISNLTGTVLEDLKGADYLVTKTDIAGKYFELGPAITKTLAAQTTIDHSDAVVFTGTAKLLYIVDDLMNPTINLLYIFDGASLEGVVDVSMPAPYDLTASVHGNTTVLDNYKVWKTAGDTNAMNIKVSITDENQIHRIDNDDTNVMGYALAKVADDDIISETCTSCLFLLSDTIVVPPSENVNVPGTYFNLKFTTDHKIDVRRVETETVANCTLLDKDHEDYAPFLKRDVRVCIVSPPSPPDTTPPVISDVEATSITENSAIITWATDEPSDSLVKYGTSSGSYTYAVSNTEYVTSHSLAIIGFLSSNTTYYYVVNSTDPSGNSAQSVEHSFTTLISLEEKLEALIEFVQKIYDALPEGVKKKIGPWPF